MPSLKDATVKKLADMLRPSIATMEASPQTTRGHYGFYMSLISRFADDRGQAKVLVESLIEAGADKRGVNDAMRICYP